MCEKPPVETHSTFTFTRAFSNSTLITHVNPVQVFNCAHVKIMRHSKPNFKRNEIQKFIPFLLFTLRVILAIYFQAYDWILFWFYIEDGIMQNVQEKWPFT